MKNIDNIVVKESTSILDVIKIIDRNSKQIAIVVDDNYKLLGTINDGDIRRAILKNISLTESVKDIYFKTPVTANINDSKEEIINICKTKNKQQIPVLDNDGKLIGLEILNDLITKEDKLNKVVIMAGGLGTRLRPLTEKIPKPMLMAGKKPILLTILEKFAEYGYRNIVMCVNYRSDVIENYFENGEKFGVKIDYVYEKKRMGTAGSLSLLDGKLKEPFFVINGDILTSVNFEHLHNFHLSNRSVATMCVHEHNFQIPYGVVDIKNDKILSIVEKPVKKFFINAGIYMISPSILEYIPQNEFYDMPTLFEKIISENKKKVIPFPIREYWLDIGSNEEYKKAIQEYDAFF